MQLAERGPLADVIEKVYLSGESTGLALHLQRAGWAVYRDGANGDESREPRMEIASPDGVLRWAGAFNAADFGPDAVVLDTVALARVVEGKALGSYVPVGCATTLVVPGRAPTFF
jgi:hypothetical protein